MSSEERRAMIAQWQDSPKPETKAEEIKQEDKLPQQEPAAETN
jgi:hypothetical protein